MEIVYIISTHNKSNKNKYKLGKHAGTLRKLESRYVTPLINPIVYFFYPTVNASDIENEIKKQLIENRVVNNNGRKTEWFCIELKVLINKIFDLDVQFRISENTVTKNNDSKTSKLELSLQIEKEKTKQMKIKLAMKEMNEPSVESEDEHEENPIYKNFLDECTEESKTHIHTSVLYGAFKSWYIKKNPNTKIPSNKIFVAELRNYIVIENVKMNSKATTGTKYLKLITNTDFDS